MTTKVLAVFLSSMTTLSTTAALADGLRVQASDILETPLAGYFAQCDSPKVTCSFEGSVSALAAIRNGAIDLAIIAVPDGQQPPEDLVSVPFAFDVATVMVNDSNPLKEISLPTLAAVLSKDSASTDKWGALGLKEPWDTRSITIYLPATSSGVTLQLLRSKTIVGGQFKESVGTWANKDVMGQIVAGQTASIVVMRGIKIPGGGRALSISAKDGADQYAYQPTRASVFYGDYALRLPFYIVTRPDASPEVKSLINDLLSDKTADLLESNDFVPVPKSERHMGE